MGKKGLKCLVFLEKTRREREGGFLLPQTLDHHHRRERAREGEVDGADGQNDGRSAGLERNHQRGKEERDSVRGTE